jgi:hypothetical protein
VRPARQQYVNHPAFATVAYTHAQQKEKMCRRKKWSVLLSMWCRKQDTFCVCKLRVRRVGHTTVVDQKQSTPVVGHPSRRVAPLPRNGAKNWSTGQHTMQCTNGQPCVKLHQACPSALYSCSVSFSLRRHARLFVSLWQMFLDLRDL